MESNYNNNNLPQTGDKVIIIYNEEWSSKLDAKFRGRSAVVLYQSESTKGSIVDCAVKNMQISDFHYKELYKIG